MHTFEIPHTLPISPGIQPAFMQHFSGWHLGMGLPASITGLLHGLSMLGQQDPDCRATAMGMGVWGMQAYPLAPSMGEWAVRLDGCGLVRNDKAPALFERLASLPSLGAEENEARETWHVLARQGDRNLALRFLAVTLADPVKGLAWLGHIWQDMLYMDMPGLPMAALDIFPWDEVTQPLKARLEAEWAFHFLAPDEALEKIQALDADMWGLWRAYAGGELLLRMKETEAGRAVLADLWKVIPWHVNLTLKLYDLFNPLPTVGDDATDGVAILAYSWNKADLLADTLDSLADSDIGNARIFTLNNGSTDHTAEVLEAARNRFGKDRFHIETLPVNVGAPAARNWLLSLPEVKASQWAAFLDDDIVLVEDWLRKLLAGSRVMGNVGTVGCRITAATLPYGLQSADYNLFPTQPAPMEPGKLPNRVLVFDNCAGSLDTGMFSYTRPCLSVSGCCHMINMAAVEKAGGFDLRYTPSQFDDLDRDLRSALADMPAVYVGDLAVRHVQHSSLAKSQTTRQIGHVMGNKFKLDTKYTDDELARLGQMNMALLWRDLEEKHLFLLDKVGRHS